MQGSGARDGSASESSALCSILAHTCRLLHSLLSLDPAYPDSGLGKLGDDTFGGGASTSLKTLVKLVAFPPGALLGAVDLPVAVCVRERTLLLDLR